MRTHFERRLALLGHPTDSGMSLIEMLVAMVTTMIVITAFLFTFFALNNSASNTTDFAGQQGVVRADMRYLESDIRSADPLVQVPRTFTSDPNGTSNLGTYGTSPVDIIAMDEQVDLYSPCPPPNSSTTASSTTIPIGPLATSPPDANVIWAYDPVAQTLTRYTWCTQPQRWKTSIILRNVTTPAASMFQLEQGATTSSSTTLLSQNTIPSFTVIPNQSVPDCGVAISASIAVKIKGQSTPFSTHILMAMPNQPGFSLEGCS